MKLLSMLLVMFLAFVPIYFLFRFMWSKIKIMNFNQKLILVRRLLLEFPTEERYRQLKEDFNYLIRFDIYSEEFLKAYRDFILKYETY